MASKYGVNLSRSDTSPHSVSKEGSATYAKIAIVEILNELKSSTPCYDCGVKYPHYVMDFDHRDSSKKRFAISTRNWKTV